MGLLVYKFSDYAHTAEREQYVDLCKQLKDYYHSREEICLFIANYNVDNCELDGVLIKQDAIIVVEFKNYGGKVTAVENGKWKLASGVEVKGGSGKTVYQQVHRNRIAIRNGFRDDGILPQQLLKNIDVLVVFHKPVTIDNRLSEKTQSWLRVGDETSFMEKVKVITSEYLYLSQEDILSLVERLPLGREYLDEEFSNVELLEKKEPEIEEEKESDEHQQETVNPSEMMSNMALPSWLDDYLFGTLKACYNPSRANMMVIGWGELDLLNYLGTYFPRSFTESYCIFSYLFTDVLAGWRDKTTLSVFDFGCGTGGELVGLITAIGDRMPSIKRISVRAVDGNKHAMRLCEKIIGVVSEHTSIDTMLYPACDVVEDNDEMRTMASVMPDDFDIVIAFKTLCELITKERFEGQNVYKCFAEVLLPKIKQGGKVLLADVTTYNDKAGAWLPKMMDEGIMQTNCNVLRRNENYNQTFTVSHTRKKSDVSKIAWRLIEKKE